MISVQLVFLVALNEIGKKKKSGLDLLEFLIPISEREHKSVRYDPGNFCTPSSKADRIRQGTSYILLRGSQLEYISSFHVLILPRARIQYAR